MKAALVSILLLALCGCFGPPKPITVYGVSGKAYQAPDLCGALVACKMGGETSCYYNSETDIQTFTDGTHIKATASCKEASGKTLGTVKK